MIDTKDKLAIMTTAISQALTHLRDNETDLAIKALEKAVVKKYTIRIKTYVYAEVEVEAYNQEEAEEMALEDAHCADWGEPDTYEVEVERIW